MGMVPLSLWPPRIRMRSIAPAPFLARPGHHRLRQVRLRYCAGTWGTAQKARQDGAGRYPQPSGLSFFLIFLANSGRIVGRCGIRGPRVDGASPGLHLAALEIFPLGRTQPALVGYPRLVFCSLVHDDSPAMLHARSERARGLRVCLLLPRMASIARISVQYTLP